MGGARAGFDPEWVCPPTYSVTREERVSVRFRSGLELEGLLRMELPEMLNRASDFLNGPEDFFALMTADGVVLVNKRAVFDTRVYESSPLPLTSSPSRASEIGRGCRGRGTPANVCGCTRPRCIAPAHSNATRTPETTPRCTHSAGSAKPGARTDAATTEYAPVIEEGEPGHARFAGSAHFWDTNVPGKRGMRSTRIRSRRPTTARFESLKLDGSESRAFGI